MITCKLERGVEVLLRHVTVNGIVIKDNRILLCKRGTYQGKPILESGKWAMVGGFVDRDETVKQALIREAREESGCVLEDITLFHIKDNPDRPAEDRQNIEFVFIAHTKSDFKEGNEEASALAWFELDNLPPREQIAFDHGDDLELYKRYLSNKFPLPFVGKI